MLAEAGRRERGFTLLEVLVAFVIAALALGVLFRGALDGLAATRTAGRYEEAVSRARSHLAQLGRTATLIPSDRQGDEGGGFHWRERILPVAQVSARRAGSGGSAVPSSAAPVSLYDVTVSMSWQIGGRTRSVQLDTQRVGFAAAQPR